MIIDRIWKSQPGKYFCLSTKSVSNTWKDWFFHRNDIGKIADFIEEHRSSDLYFCPHGFSEKRRRKAFAVKPNLLWADLDEADPRQIKYRPSIAFESSPGRFVGLWLIDGEMTEELNRRLTYLIDGDVSGWDLTQVLRVPGTINFKYTSQPRTRIMWTDGPEYELKKLGRELPAVDGEADEVDVIDASEVYKRWEKKLPHWCRRELLHGKPAVGKRSEMLWKLGNELIEQGVDRDDAFVLLKASPWNKFRGRRSEDEQLRRELDKSVGKHLKNGRGRPLVSDNEVGQKDYVWLARPLDEVPEENIDWLWYPYLARGELTILEGDPERGKSYLAQMVAGHFCDGLQLPSVKEGMPIVTGKVAYFDIENSAGSITVKRMRGNGFKALNNYIQEEAIFSIDDDDTVPRVVAALEKMKPVMIVFDTINTYLGRADAFKGHEAQQAFVRFREIAKRLNCAVLVLRHLTKSSKERALYRGQGSIAFAGIARVVLTVGAMPDDPDVRVMAVTKLNIAQRPKALTFTIAALPDKGKETDRSVFKWGEFVDLTADDMLATTATPGKGNERESAIIFLKETLAEGPVEFVRIERMAETRSISTRTLQRAAEALNLNRRVTGFGKTRCSVWSLPEK